MSSHFGSEFDRSVAKALREYYKDSVYYVLKEVFSNENQTKLMLDIKIPEQYNAKMDKWIEEDYLLMEKDLLSNNYIIYNKY